MDATIALDWNAHCWSTLDKDKVTDWPILRRLGWVVMNCGREIVGSIVRRREVSVRTYVTDERNQRAS